jgi:hypothetical protein
MSDPKHPTNPEWEMFDPLEYPAPVGVSLLLINEGGTLILGQWYNGARAWSYKPGVPNTVKNRMHLHSTT